MRPEPTIKSLSELPTMPSTIGTMTWNQTGDWRYAAPVVANRPAPCSRDCPLSIPIPDYLSAINRGDLRTALSLLLAHNPMPGLTGRLCYHPCRTRCARKKSGRAIPIQQIERSMADLARDAASEPGGRSDKEVTIVGSGPLGLSCAFYLGCRGLRVTVLENRGQAGGALADLSSKKITAPILQKEIDRLIDLAGIHLQTNARFDGGEIGRSFPQADLIVLDPTALLQPSAGPGDASPFDPFAGEEMGGRIVAVSLPKNLRPFKPPMIAHYLAAGRTTAEKALEYLLICSRQSGDGSEPSARAESMEKVRDRLFSALHSVTAPAVGQDGTWREALGEAARCSSCGTCNLCLQCVASCPDACIHPDRDKTCITVDLEYCKGCGLCAHECPREVLTMEVTGV